MTASAENKRQTGLLAGKPADEPLLLGVRYLTPKGLLAAPLPASLSLAQVQRAADGLGFVRLGVADVQDVVSETATAEATAHLNRWLDEQYQGSMTFMQTPRQTPSQLLPGARSVIVVAAPTETPNPVSAATGYVAAYARGADYHTVIKDKLWQLAQRLCDAQQAPLHARVCVDTAPILERHWARLAGITFTGKSTMAIAPGIGTTLLLGLLIVNVPLPASPQLPDGCGACTRCLDACPTQAFPTPFVLDARRCLAYVTIEHDGEIPVALRPHMGTHVFGCDICQQVCPYNASKKRPLAMAELAATPAREAASLAQWLLMTSSDYRRLSNNSALRRSPRARLQRNAAVALGNVLSSSPLIADLSAEAVAALCHSLAHNPNPSVRQHAAWALGEVSKRAETPGDSLAQGANQALTEALKEEAVPFVLAEVRQALGLESKF